VLAAFGVDAEPVPLTGGRGTAWRCGELVLKPLDTSIEELEWQVRLLSSLVPDGFRVSRLHGLHDGWCAWDFVEGVHRERAWPDVIAVGDRFHAALAGVERPRFLDRRTSHWAVGDRVAWGELPTGAFWHVKHMERLAAALRPVDESASQLVHCDLTGNVLFAEAPPPAVIDFSPSWRPPAFASAVVVGDALLWEGADETLLAAVADVDDFPQFLLRALIFRAVVDALFRAGEPWRPDGDDCFLRPVELAYALAE
jgi:uncharacterized protein (TIGR02569 family)